MVVRGIADLVLPEEPEQVVEELDLRDVVAHVDVPRPARRFAFYVPPPFHVIARRGDVLPRLVPSAQPQEDLEGLLHVGPGILEGPRLELRVSEWS